MSGRKPMLDKTQVLFLRDICSVRRITPRVAIKTPLNVPSLSVEIKALAMRTTFRLSCDGEWKTISFIGNCYRAVERIKGQD